MCSRQSAAEGDILPGMKSLRGDIGMKEKLVDAEVEAANRYSHNAQAARAWPPWLPKTWAGRR